MKLSARLSVNPGKRLRLSGIDPGSTPGVRDKANAQRILERNLGRLSELQYDLYAENQRALLVVLQAMDAGGKDGTIRRIATGLNPQGCRVTSFKVPSAEEAGHDFLWRIHRAVPARGEIGIFNRSHYEDVLVVRVHDLAPKSVWSERYDQINAFERYLAETGTVILKIFLHISKEEQKRRFLERIDDPRKRWKFSPADLEKRKRWDDYQKAYEEALRRCATPSAPWFVAVSQILVDTLEEMNPRLPRPEFDVSKMKIE
jgi:PPK2 family polyphosphate:nucleotide phosphotransferase